MQQVIKLDHSSPSGLAQAVEDLGGVIKSSGFKSQYGQKGKKKSHLPIKNKII